MGFFKWVFLGGFFIGNPACTAWDWSSVLTASASMSSSAVSWRYRPSCETTLPTVSSCGYTTSQCRYRNKRKWPKFFTFVAHLPTEFSLKPIRQLSQKRGIGNVVLVMATLAKRKRTTASIIVFSSISKRSEHLR